VPSRKQRRRRQKERRHEYEYVYVDEEGQEVEVDEPEPGRPAPRKDGSKTPSRGGRPVRKVEPPSWRRASRKALIMGPLLLLLIYLTSSKRDLATIVPTAVIFLLIFLPFNYMMDSMLYRSYLKRTGQAPAQPPRARRAKEPKTKA
jgi:hypothetical protein